MAMIAVDPEKQSDPFYRYKMPRVQIKGEGNGNGIKTVIVNVEEISQRLNRDVNHPMKFFAYELAATAKYKDDKWILTGSFTQERVQAALYDFIKKFVLCKSCRNPETIVQVDESKMVWLNCKACASVGMVDPREKLCNQIAKTEQPVKMAEGRKKGKKGEKGEKTKKEQTKDEKEEEEYNRDARHATDADDIVITPSDTKGDLPNPVEVLKEFINSAPAPSEADIAHKIREVKTDYGFKDKQVVLLVFQVLFDDGDVIPLINQYSKLLKRILKADTQKYIITGLEHLCAEKEELKSKFPRLLKEFFDNGVVNEETVLGWHSSKIPKTSIDKTVLKFFREKSAPLIEWLKEDDDESDEEDEESDDAPSPPKAKATPAAPKAKAADDDDVDIDAI